MRIQGKTWRIVTTSPYKTEVVATDLFMLGVMDAGGNITDYVRAGRPSTYRVYTDLQECRNGIRGNKRFFKEDVTLVPVRLLTGELVKETAE